jgi:hypothetical protein
MTLPTVPVTTIRLGTGASFGDPLILGDALDGILGTNVLASSAIEVVDVSSTVQRISIRQGRDRLFEEYLPGEATIQFLDTTGDWNPPTPPAPITGRSSRCARCRSRPPIPAPPTTCSPATSPHGITPGPTSQSTTPSSPSNASTASGSCPWPTLTLWPAPPPTTSQANASTRSSTLSTGPPHNATSTQATPSSRTTQVGFDQPCRQSRTCRTATSVLSSLTTTGKPPTTAETPCRSRRPAPPTNSTTTARTSNTRH